MKILCVLNPASGDGVSLQRWPEIAGILDSMRAHYELLADKEMPLEQQLMSRLENRGVEGIDVIAGIGGDGTQSAIINTLMRFSQGHPSLTMPPYGFIPLGTGNNIAKSFTLVSATDLFTNDLHRAVATLVHGADYRLDLGVLNGTYFADAITIGIDSHVAKERNVRKRRIEQIPVLRRIVRGYLLYTLVYGRRFWQHKRLDAEIVIDNVLWYSGPILNLIVNNTRIYAGEFDFCTNGYGNDGLLDVVVFTGHTDYLRKYLLSIRHNPRNIRRMATTLSRHASQRQGRQVSIRLSRPDEAQLDGEELPASDRFEVGIVPGAIHIKTPAEP
jgi:diacylglycerol kinase (ATP)